MQLKKGFNIFLVCILVLGILSSAFGTYAVAFAAHYDGGQGTQTETDEDSDNGKTTQLTAPEMPDFSKASNEMELKEDVVVFDRKESREIEEALLSVTPGWSGYNEGGSLTYEFSGEKEALFGDLDSGDIFVLNTNDSPAGNQIMKVSSMTHTEEIVRMHVVQPELGEVFDNIDIAFNDVLTEENLVNAVTADGISMHFGDIDKEIKDVSATQSFDTGGNAPSAPQVMLLAEEYSTEPTDLIIELEYDARKTEDEEEEKDSNATMEVEADLDCKFTGKIGVEDLSAYMVCDMPKPAQFNELMFGIRGKTVVGAGFDVNLNAAFHPKATKFEYDGLFVEAEISGLNEKWVPLGIWQFAGTTMVKVSKDAFEVARVAPSIFVMLYMDAEGQFQLDFNSTLTYERTFNTGLSVFHEGELNMNVVNYPYALVNGEAVPPEQKTLVWETEVSLDADASLTLMGSSVQFYFAGIHIGEIQILDIGLEADAHISVKADNVNGVTTSSDEGKTDLYLRAFLKVLGLRAKVSAEVEAFQRKLSGEVDFAFQLLDITLFHVGKMPDKYKNKVPVSDKWVPSEFETVVCLVSDVSGSMDEYLSEGGTKIEALKEAAHVITGAVESTAANNTGNYGLSVVAFSDEGRTVAVPHNDYPFIDACIDTLDAGGGTNIKGGLDVGVSQLENVEAKHKVLIVMTDGQDGYNSKDKLVEAAKQAAEKDIAVFTIGFGNSVNESLLQEMAQQGGGEYRYSAADSAVSIIGSFLYSYESSSGEVLLDSQSTVAEGETVTADTFTVPDESGDLNTTLYWPGSLLKIILIDPNGRKVDKDYPGAVINDSQIPATVTVKDPLPGQWKYRVRGIETSYDQEPFYAIAAFREVERESVSRNPQLRTLTLVGAYCLPIGVFAVLVSTTLLIFVNRKKKA